MTNYHTHTNRCKHATGDLKAYVEQASLLGAKELGMSDHVPFPDNRWLGVRMAYEEKTAYYADLKEAQSLFPNIHLLQGFECEYLPMWHNYYKEELKEQDGCDYLILAGHIMFGSAPWNLEGRVLSPLENLKGYTDYLTQAMATGLFDFVAHPDVFGEYYSVWDEEAKACARAILEAAVTYRMPLEINGYGFRKPPIDTPEGSRLRYPLNKFWELAQDYQVEVLINSDAHKPVDVLNNKQDGLNLVNQYGLTLLEGIKKYA
jgi:histidinol-phosphatase (PHP family)